MDEVQVKQVFWDPFCLIKKIAVWILKYLIQVVQTNFRDKLLYKKFWFLKFSVSKQLGCLCKSYKLLGKYL